MSSTNVKSTLMAVKLKDGVQDAIVYLRMLEGAKLAPVYERKRKQLMQQLLDLQGDTRRDAPPKFESDSDGDDETATTDPASPVKLRENATDKPKLSDRMSKFEKPSTSGSGGRNFQYKTLEQLKKRNSVNLEEKPKSEPEPEPEPEPIVEEKPDKSLTVPKPRDDTSSPSATPETKRKHKLGGGLLNKVKKNKNKETKERSSTLDSVTSTDTATTEEDKPPTIAEPPATEPPLTPSNKPKEETKVEELTEEDEVVVDTNSSKPFSSMVEKVSRRLGRYTYQKMEMELLEDTVKFWKHNQNKEKGTTLSLVGAASAIRDSYQFELHTPDKSYTFRAESEELCAKWISVLSEAIDKCNPIEEEPISEEGSVMDNKGTIPESASIPQISVSSSVEASPEKNPPPLPTPNVRASVSYENFSPGPGKKGKKEMPDMAGAKVKGYMYKKGTFSKWEKAWLGLIPQDNTLYISSNETSKKIHSTVSITTDTKIEKKKGTEKLPHALCIVNGKMKDTFATDSLQEYSVWIFCLEQATSGPNDIEELLSEDEEDGELYEELGAGDSVPDLPSTPRPPASPRMPPAVPHPNSSIPTSDELYDGFDGDDGDIYEGLDEMEMPSYQPPPPIASLPPKRGSDPLVHAPSLPPRNAPPIQAPSLPPRPPKASEPVPLDYEAPNPSPPIKKKVDLAAPIDDDVYDDVLTGPNANDDILEETYDDVEVVTPKRNNTLPREPSAGELYEDMVPEVGKSSIELDEDDEYSDMTLSGDPPPIDEELYDDVEAPLPPRPPKATPTITSPLVTTKITPLSSNVKSPPANKVTTPTNKVTTPTNKVPPASTTTKLTTPTTSAKSSTVPSKTTPTSAKLTTTITTSTKQNSLSNKGSLTPDSIPKPRVMGTNTRPSSAGAKKLNTTGKVAQMSKMFGQSEDKDAQKPATSPTLKKPTNTGEILYKSPGKSSYVTNYCVLENGILVFYRSQGDKLSHFRLSLRDAGLKLGKPHDQDETGYKIEVLKGTLTHYFCLKSKDDYVNWMRALVTSTQKVCPEKEDLYFAPKDHKAENDREISFKKESILWVILREMSQWYGIEGSSESSFTNNAGAFPPGTVDAVTSEDVYI